VFVAGLVLLFLSGAGFGAMLGWYVAELVTRLRRQYGYAQLERETANARYAVDAITRQAQSNLAGLVAEGLSRRR
jgi:hypothetical protein